MVVYSLNLLSHHLRTLPWFRTSEDVIDMVLLPPDEWLILECPEICEEVLHGSMGQNVPWSLPLPPEACDRRYCRRISVMLSSSKP